MYFSEIFVFCLLIFFNNFQTLYADLNNLENNLGDKCDLGHASHGYCTEISDCPYAKKLFQSGKSSQIVLCKFIGKTPFVCCPKEDSTVKSSKFEKALCKNNESQIKVNVHVYKGQETEIEDFPFQVAIGYRQYDEEDISFNCGGSLIADDIVLTAAHCANRKNAPVIVRLGRTSLDLNDLEDDASPQDIEIQNIEIHSDYSRWTRHNDIALLKLSRPAKMTEFVQTACLSTEDRDLSKKYIITGYGAVDQQSTVKSNKLLKGIIEEYSIEKCKQEIALVGQVILNSQFCAYGNSGTDTCRGDSGGPVSYEENNQSYIYAITSYGVSCGSSYPGIYTKVNKYLDWIEKTMALLE